MHPLPRRAPAARALKAQTGVRLVGINQKDAPENALAFLTELGNPYDAIGVDANGRVSIDWGVYGVPETFVVNADGIITYKHIGPITAQSLAAEVLPAIEKAKGANPDSDHGPSPRGGNIHARWRCISSPSRG